MISNKQYTYMRLSYWSQNKLYTYMRLPLRSQTNYTHTWGYRNDLKQAIHIHEVKVVISNKLYTYMRLK